jgi:hypothetical protein
MTTWGEVARQVEQLSDRCDAFFARRAAQKADKIARNATKRVDKARRDEEHRETIENPDDPGVRIQMIQVRLANRSWIVSKSHRLDIPTGNGATYRSLLHRRMSNDIYTALV